MSEHPSTATMVASRVGSGAGRLVRAWQAMPRERRLAAYAALGLFISMFLPWYQRQFFVVLGGKIAPAADSQTAWGAFSFVEAAILLVAGGILTLLFQRAEGKAFHLPGGDGGVITAAGVWSAILIIWRIFDKQGGSAHGQNATTYGIEWGIFVALAVAVWMAYTGSRIRAAHQPEPPLPGEEEQRPPAAPSRAESQREAASPTGPQSGAASPTGPQSGASSRARASRRPPAERPVGWLTARPEQREADERPSEAAQPVDDTAATLPARRESPLPPATPAARRRQPPDDELTIPLERED